MLKSVVVVGCSVCAILLVAALPAVAEPTTSALVERSPGKSGDSSQLEGVVIVSRHGNRSFLKDTAVLNRETSNTWPSWSVEPGYLTSRGRKLMVDMGGYYRDKFTKDGLLTGNDSEDVKHAYFHTNTIQRTIQTGCALAEGLFPSTTTTIHYLVDKKDALFNGAPLDETMKDAAVRGRIGDNASALGESMSQQFDLVEKTLGRPGLYARTLSSIGLAAGIADNYMCEYCEGLPMDQVAFGRATPAELKEMLKILALDFDLNIRTPYLARTRMSNLVSHITSTLQQVASGKPVKGAFGDADDKLYVIVGHDTTLSSIAGILRLDWVLPDTGRNLCPPGGAIVFELRKRSAKNSSGKEEHFVRVYYAAETLAQMHGNTKLSLDTPPSLAPIFVHGASRPVEWYDSSLQDFVKTATQAIDPELVYAIDDGNQK